jgi:hypothetical protein
MANIPGKSKKLYNFSNKKKDKIKCFQFTFQGSKNTANKKTRQNILSKKAKKIKKKHIGSDTILLNQAAVIGRINLKCDSNKN